MDPAEEGIKVRSKRNTRTSWHGQSWIKGLRNWLALETGNSVSFWRGWNEFKVPCVGWEQLHPRTLGCGPGELGSGFIHTLGQELKFRSSPLLVPLWVTRARNAWQESSGMCWKSKLGRNQLPKVIGGAKNQESLEQVW